MKRHVVLVLVTALLLLGSSVAIAQDATPDATPAPPPTVFVRQDPTLGPFLTDAEGNTLYLFTNDTEPGVSTCYDQCAENWPPFTADEPLTLPNGVDGALTPIPRDDGTTMVAYNDIPLYYFARDEQPGDTNGQGAGDVWYVVPPGAAFGDPPVTATPEAAAATPAAAGEVQVSLIEFAVDTSTTTFAVGQEYTFTVSNDGGFPHEFVIETVGAERVPLEADGQSAVIEALEPGTSGTLTWTFTEPGLYQFACHVRTHYPQGMAVTIRVV